MAFNKLTYKIDANSSSFTRELKKAETAFDRFQRENRKGLANLRSASLLAAKGIGILATAATAAAVTIGVKSVKAAAGFERAIVSAGAKAGATSEQLKQMEASAISAAAGAEFSARQAADAMGFLAAAGFNVREQMAALPDVLNLASAGEMDLAQSADLASNVLAQFTMEVEELSRVNDVLVKAANSSNTSVYQLGEALSYSGPAAKGAGISLEETVAAIGKLSDAGIQADRAGSGLTQILIQMRAAAKKMGVELSGADIASLGFAGSLEKLTDAGLTAQNAGEFFTARAQVSVQALLSQGIPAIRELDAALEAAGGTAQEVADKKINTLQGSFNILEGNIDNLMIALGKQFSPAVKAAADELSLFSIGMRENSDLLAALRDGFVDLIGMSAEFIRMVGLATNVLITFGGVLGEVNVILRSVASTLAVAGHGVGLFASGVKGDLDGIKDSAKSMASSFKNSFMVFGEVGDSMNAANAVGTRFQDTTFGIADGLQNIAAKARVANKELEAAQNFMGPMPPGALSSPLASGIADIPRVPSAGKSDRALRTDANRLLAMVETPFQRYAAEIEKLDKAMDAGYISTDKYGKIVQALKEEFEPATIHATKLLESAQKLGDQFGALGRDDLREGLAWATELFEDGVTSVEDYTQALASLRDEADYFQSLMRESDQLKESLKTPFDLAAESMQRYNDMLEHGLITIEEFGAAAQRVGESIYTELTAGVDQMIAEQEAVAKRWEGIWDDASRRVVDVFSNSVGDAFLGVLEGNVDAVKDAVKGLIKEMVILAAKAAILNAIQAGGGGAPGGVLGSVLGFAGGGYVSGPGTSTSDSIPARLSDGEYVIRARAVQKWGAGYLDDINAMRTPASGRRQKFATGGPVGGGSGGGESIRIVNVIDPSEVEAVMSGPAGERVIVNVISRRATEIKRVLA